MSSFNPQVGGWGHDIYLPLAPPYEPMVNIVELTVYPGYPTKQFWNTSL